MKLPKAQWHLAGFLIPAMIASLVLLSCFPTYLFGLIIGVCLCITLLNSIRLFSPVKETCVQPSIITHSPNQRPEPGSSPKPGRRLDSKYFFTIFNSIFLGGVSLIFFIFLTAADHLSPDALVFESLKNLWEIIFPLGIGFLMAQLAVSFKPSSLLKTSPLLLMTREKTRICIELFLNFSSFGALIIGLELVIFTVSNALIRLIGFSISNELQLQTIIASTLIGLPFLTKRWKKRRYLDFSISRRKRLFKLSLIMIFSIIVLEILTLPFASDPIASTLIQPTLGLTQWKLFISSWWMASISLLARQITERSHEKSLSTRFTTLIIASGCVYVLGVFLLTAGGQDYFLTVLKHGVLALILTSLPIAAFIFNLANFQGTVKFTTSALKNVRQQKRNEQHVSHTLIRTIALTCGLYWTTGLSLLSPLLFMVTAPSILLFLLV